MQSEVFSKTRVQKQSQTQLDGNGEFIKKQLEDDEAEVGRGGEERAEWLLLMADDWAS